MKTGIYANYRTVSGLRTRFFPKSRINQGLISVAPWINILLLIVFFVWLDSKVVLQPGRVVELPDVPFTGGSRPLIAAIVVAGSAGTDLGGDDVVYFDDVRYVVSQPGDATTLKQALQRHFEQRPEADLGIQADRRAAYGTVMHLVEMAREAGITRVNLSSRQVEPFSPIPTGRGAGGTSSD